MPRTRPAYPPEFRLQMVELVRSGRPIRELARDFECSKQTIRNRLRQADLDEGLRDDGLMSVERHELRRLRRENRHLRREREISANTSAGRRGRPVGSRKLMSSRNLIRRGPGFPLLRLSQ